MIGGTKTKSSIPMMMMNTFMQNNGSFNGSANGNDDECTWQKV